jgi:hypothetical protein
MCYYVKIIKPNEITKKFVKYGELKTSNDLINKYGFIHK